MIAPLSYHRPFQDNQYSLRVLVEPTYLPVTVTEVCRELDLDYASITASETEEIEGYIGSATEMFETDTQRSVTNKTWVLKMDFFPPVIELRRPPITAVSSVQYIDLDGATQTWAASNYDTDLSSAPGRIMLADDSTGWPSTNDEPNAVIVTFTAGYGNNIPRLAWKAILLAVKALYHGCDVGDSYWNLVNRLRWEGGV